MPRNKKAIPAAGGRNDQAVEPTPPENMWEEMARELENLNKRPPNSFTCKEYQEKFGISRYMAHKDVATLIKTGKIEQVGLNRNPNVYYIWRGK